MEDRVQVLSAVLDKVLTKIDALSPMSGTMTSPVDIALATKRDQILDALNRGFAPGTIARMLADADAPFAQESIRLGIVRIRDSAKASSKLESRSRRNIVLVSNVVSPRRKRDADVSRIQVADAIASRPKRDAVAESDAVSSRRPSSVSSIAHLNSDV
ncbi:MAG: hypothetical protein M3N13_10285 [Candidatus Eremiobacteraeota bacterium]|nr:hypothetical protein [Candidatus Eremiobacteraeota bacterium]